MVDIIRKGLWNDIVADIQTIEELREIDERHYYEPHWKGFKDEIKALHKVVMARIKEYEKRYGVKLSVALIKRALKA